MSERNKIEIKREKEVMDECTKEEDEKEKEKNKGEAYRGRK